MNLLIAAHLRERLQKQFCRNTKLTEHPPEFTPRVLQHAKEQMLHADIGVTHALCLILRINQNPVQFLPDTQFSALHLRQTLKHASNLCGKYRHIDIHLLKQLRDQALAVRQKRIEQMLGPKLLIAEIVSRLFTALNRFH